METNHFEFTIEDYYNMRRKNLDENGYNQNALQVIP